MAIVSERRVVGSMIPLTESARSSLSQNAVAVMQTTLLLMSFAISTATMDDTTGMASTIKSSGKVML